MQGEFYLAKSGRRRLQAAPLPLDLQAAIDDASPDARLGAIIELRARLLSDNLPAALGARDTLAAMDASDTQMVATAARAGLDELVLRVSPTSFDFGEVTTATTTPSQRIELSGPPLALHVNVRASEPWIKIQEDRTSYALSVAPSAAGEMHGTVTFSGAAGDAVVNVRAVGVNVKLARQRGVHTETTTGRQQTPPMDKTEAEGKLATTARQQTPPKDKTEAEGKPNTRPIRPPREFPALPRVAYAELRKRLTAIGDVVGAVVGAVGIAAVLAGTIVTLFTIDQPKPGKLLTAFASFFILAGLRLATGEWRAGATQALTAGSFGLVTGIFALIDNERLP